MVTAAIAKQPTQQPAAVPAEPFVPVVITLAGHPRGKGRPRRDRLPNGVYVTHTDAKTRDYESNLHYAAAQVMNGQPPFTGPLEVVIEAFFPIPASWSGKRRSMALGGEIRPTVIPDWNNLGGVTDGCNGVVWIDDRQIVNGTVVKHYSAAPRLVITVTPINGAEDKRPPPSKPVRGTDPRQTDLEQYLATPERKR